MAKAFEIKISKTDRKFLLDFGKRFGTIEGRKRLLATLIPLYDKLGMVVAGHISRKELSGQLLNARTSALRKSILGQAEIMNNLPAIVVGVFKGPALVYAGIQNDGGIIKPKKAKTLAMPIGAGALTGSGIGRYESPRDYPTELTYFPINRHPVIAGLMDENGDLQYLLLREVEIKAKHYLEIGIEKNLDLIAEATVDLLAKEILKV